MSNGTSASSETSGSGAPGVLIRVPLGPSTTSRQVAPGTRVTAVFPRNPQGTWTAPRVNRPDVARTSVRRTPAGMTLEIVALAPGSAVVAVHSTPSGDPRPPGRIRLPGWELRLTVTDA